MNIKASAIIATNCILAKSELQLLGKKTPYRIPSVFYHHIFL